MGSLITFPARPFPRVAENAAKAEAFMASPHGRIKDALRRLALTGQEHAAEMTERMLARALQFPLPDGRPHPEYVALALKELLGVPSEMAASFRHARSASVAILALAYPFNEPEDVA